MHVYVFSIIRGSSMAFDQPARRALIPNILPNHLVTNGLALSTGTVQVMRILGAAGAGLLTAFFGSGITFMVSAALYGFAFLSTAYIHLPTIELEPSRDVGSMAKNLVLGLQFAWQNTAIRSVMMLSFVYFLFALSFMQVFAPLFAKQVLGLGDEGFGYMMSVSGMGGLCGALVVVSLSPDHKRGVNTSSVIYCIWNHSGFVFCQYLCVSVSCLSHNCDSRFWAVLNYALIDYSVVAICA